MSPTVSAAQPVVMARCSTVALAMDADLEARAARLEASLRAFEARCRESGMRVSVDGVRGRVSAHARVAVNIDQFLGQVGKAFEAADRVAQWVSIQALSKLPTGKGQENSPLLAFWDIVAGFADAPLVDKLHDVLLSRMDWRLALDIIGRGLNWATGTSGHVTDLRSLYKTLIADQFPYWQGIDGALRRAEGHKIGSGALSVGALTLVSTGLEIYREWREGKFGGDLVKSIGVNVGSEGLKLVLKRAHPWVLGAVVVNAVVQTVGSIGAWVEGVAINALVGDAQARSSLIGAVEASQQALERADLKNVFDSAAETLWDLGAGYVSSYSTGLAAGAAALQGNPSVGGVWQAYNAYSTAFAQSEQQNMAQLGENLLGTGQALVNVPLGLLEFGGSQVALAYGVMGYGLAEGIGSFPGLPAEWQASLHDAGVIWAEASSVVATGISDHGHVHILDDGGGGGNAS
jgi:hypothetical protein